MKDGLTKARSRTEGRRQEAVSKKQNKQSRVLALSFLIRFGRVIPAMHRDKSGACAPDDRLHLLFRLFQCSMTPGFCQPQGIAQEMLLRDMLIGIHSSQTTNA